MPTPEDVTALLDQWYEGDPDAFDQVVSIVYEHLRQIAHKQFHKEKRHSISATDVLHEAILRMKDQQVPLESRRHFKAWAAGFLRRVLIDFARARTAQKRGGIEDPQTYVDTLCGGTEANLSPETLLTLEAGLEQLEKINTNRINGPMLVQLVQLHFYGGYSWREVAEELEISQAEVYRRRKQAHVFLFNFISQRFPDATLRQQISNKE